MYIYGRGHLQMRVYAIFNVHLITNTIHLSPSITHTQMKTVLLNIYNKKKNRKKKRLVVNDLENTRIAWIFCHSFYSPIPLFSALVPF